MTERITSQFGAESTAMEVIEGIDLTGKNAVVTGAASGIGVETARALAKAGAAVTIAARNMEKGNSIVEDIKQSTGSDKVFLKMLDLAKWDTIDTFVSDWKGPLDILINNAGVMAVPELELSPEGHEMQFATNHLGHFRLTLGLHDALKASGDARVAVVSSRANLNGGVDFDDIDFKNHPYDSALAYAQSKTANVLFAVEADKRWSADGIRVNALHPGAIIDSELSRYQSEEYLAEARKRYTFKSLGQGASTSVFVATSPLLESIGGKYFEDCNESEIVHPTGEFLPGGVADYAVDSDNAKKLWELSLNMLDESE